jgi:hypothetical protein
MSVVPVPPYRKEMIFFFFEFWRREGERWTLRRRHVLSAGIEKNSSIEENVGRVGHSPPLVTALGSGATG